MDYSLVKTDMHSHLLPGIDDGAPDLETSIALIRGYQELGYTRLITTPHILWDLYKNTPEIISGKLDQLRMALKENQVDIEIDAAAEYFLDEHVLELLRKKERLLTIRDNLVLTEFSTMHRSMSMKDILFEVQMAGYQPILAHPERYIYLYKNWDLFQEIRDNGVLFQLNLLSITGGYGSRVREIAQYLLEHDFYSFVGTDLHHEGHMERLKSLEIPIKLHELLTSGRLLNDSL
ncbi:tyrosine-protein phosphatase [Niabella beijingensis]|uniref:tyrosine-protein phosphatase n=1 Tax=Niabella beijingensis TaxID=2872700 RepID=UPI001CBA7C76|nr:CpsB/CapC family capsule biosynthesis tyrosine phosphatase [Niabella beijingensis]MBZ4190010.1 histidinol phosphatase [Niabella beijingensis]